jgi:mannitol/fructose-specific phosphotransferase system IIA component (Ntr-type)
MLHDPASMNGGLNLADYTNEALLVPTLKEKDTAGVIQELGRKLQQEGRLSDLLPFYNAALNREFLFPTAIEPGIALPHARLGGLPQLSFALGRCDEPIRWGNKTSAVRLVFLLAVPSSETAGYLNLIAGLARLGKQPQILQALLSAASEQAMWSVLKEITLRNGSPGL